MKRAVIVLCVVAALVVGGALVFRLTRPTDSTPVSSDAGLVASPPDASVIAVDAGSPIAQLPVNPPVRSSSGKSFTSVQQAIDAAAEGETVFLPHGLYTDRIIVSARKRLTLQAENGPAWFIVKAADVPVLMVDGSSDVTFDGLWFEHATNPVDEQDQSSTLQLANSARVRFRNAFITNGAPCASLVAAEDVTFESAVFRDCDAQALVSTDSSGPVHIVHSIVGEASGGPSLTFSSVADRRDAASLHVSGSAVLGATVLVGDAVASFERSALVFPPGAADGGVMGSRSYGVFAFSGDGSAGDVAAIQRARVDGGTLLLETDAALSAEAIAPELASLVSTAPSLDDRDAARERITTANRASKASGRTVIVNVGETLPVCAETPGSQIDVYDQPNGQIVEHIASCAKFGEEVGDAPAPFVVEDVKDGWVNLQAMGWIHEEDLFAADTLVSGKVVIPLPLFHSKLISTEPGSIVIAGDGDACAGVTCEYEPDEGAPPPDSAPKAEIQQERATIAVPDSLDLKSATVNHAFEPTCCT